MFDKRLTGMRGRWLTAIVWLVAGFVTGCGGSSSTGPKPPNGASGPAPTAANIEVLVTDVTGKPLRGADVSVTVDEQELHAATNGDGKASFANLPLAEVAVVVGASGFDTETLRWQLSENTSLQVTMRAEGAWAVGQPVVLGTRVVELSQSRAAMIFTVDVAVIGQGAEALETLTSDNFSLNTVDCGWGGPRDCISDAAGNHKGSYQSDGPARSFGLMPAAVRQAYRVGVLAERSRFVADWDHRVPALKSFFTMLGGNDAASLASAQAADGSTTLSILGPYTSDGSSFLTAIDDLALPAVGGLELQQSLLDWIRDAASNDPGAIPGASRTVLVAATPGMSVEEIAEAAALAQESGVHVSIVTGPYNYGLPELAVRTGGFVTMIGDPRQLGLVFPAMDRLLAGTMPFYRMEFRVTSSPGAFESGGNAKLRMLIRVPTSIPHNGVYTTFDVAIP